MLAKMAAVVPDTTPFQGDCCFPAMTINSNRIIKLSLGGVSSLLCAFIFFFLLQVAGSTKRRTDRTEYHGGWAGGTSNFEGQIIPLALGLQFKRYSASFSRIVGVSPVKISWFAFSNCSCIFSSISEPRAPELGV